MKWKSSKNYLKLLLNILTVGGFLVSYESLDIYSRRAGSSLYTKWLGKKTLKKFTRPTEESCGIIK